MSTHTPHHHNTHADPTFRDLPEIRHVTKNRLMDEEVHRKAEEESRKTQVRQRQIDRKIHLASEVTHSDWLRNVKDLKEIQIRTPSPCKSARARPQHHGQPPPPHHHHARRRHSNPHHVTTLATQTTATPVATSKQNDAAVANQQQQPISTTTSISNSSNNHPTASPRRDHHHHHHHHHHSSHPAGNDNDDSDSDIPAGLAHLRARTRRNMMISQKLSRSLEVKEERRVASPRHPPTSSPERNLPFGAISARSVEDLQRAAAVLRFTPHEKKVRELLSSVSEVQRERTGHGNRAASGRGPRH